MNTDLSFITNEENQSLKDRFEVLIKDTSFFDCLVGYFYSSGFHAIYQSLENTEKIRILIGISTSRQTFELLKNADKPKQQQIDFSHAEAKQEVENLVQKEMEDSEDNRKVEEGVHKFIEWIRSGKLEIKAYPSQNIHAKLYIMTFKEGDRDTGRVITGSSNFTQAGLVDNLEFNVELKNRSDYDFAKNKNDKEDDIFNKTIDLIANKFKYARYKPLLYYEGQIDQLEKQSQENMGKFMKILLVKRLESSFFAFRNSVDRFLHSYQMFIKELDNGNVYVSKKHTNKIFELLEDDDDEAVQRLIDEGKAEKYESKDFRKGLRKDLQHDHDILLEVKKLWQKVNRDPKLIKIINDLSKNTVLQKNHLIIFTESKETANYLFKNINKEYPGKVLLFTGDSGESIRDKVLENFDARARHPKEDYRILVSTEVLSEGVNLHRANVVINYDIPWNPTRMMQRVGRINRVDTPFDVIHTFNFFPTTQSNDQIKLKEAAEAKINVFLTLLGGDAELLTEGEPIGSHELFNRLISKKTLEGDDEAEESELKYLQVIRDIREKDADLFEKIKRLPKKARTAKQNNAIAGALITYFRRGKLQKFFMAQVKQAAEELDFMTAAGLLESRPDEKRKKLPGEMYDLLDSNKEAFIIATTVEMAEPQKRRGRDSAANILRILKATMKNTQKLTEDQELYLKKVLTQLEEGGLPKQTAKNTLRALDALKNELINPFKVLAVLQTHIPERLLQSHYAEQNPAVFGKREVIPSLYLAGE